MEWFKELLFGLSVGHSILLIAIVVFTGILLGKIKIAGISLGVTWVLFVGIVLSHFGMRMEHHALHFLKEFGLILFVYSVGLQVGPGFFSSFKKGGVTLNMLAAGVVVLGVATTCILHFATGLPVTTMVGILSGAVTNTPGLGAAQQAYFDATGAEDPSIALGYAVAYPLGVLGIILAILTIRFLFRISLQKESASANQAEEKMTNATHASVRIKNPALFGKEIAEVALLIDRKFVISRILHANESLEIGNPRTHLEADDKVFIVAASQDMNAIIAFIGEEIGMDRSEWEKLDARLVSRRIVVTKEGINGKTLGQLNLRKNFGVNITRVNRSGVDLVARAGLPLQIGDRLTVVGVEVDVANVEKVLGNSLRRLREPNLVPIFLGIALGILLGSIPFVFPGIPQPVKLGLAGGPLIVAILISRFGHRYKLVTYTTMSANLMLREIGISLFLACVGLGAGEGFVETVVHGGGFTWIGYGFLITFLPLMLIGFIGRAVYRMNYFTLSGLLAGSMTDPPALAYSNSVAGNDIPSVSYATVYPLTMFLRVLTAQGLILILV
ncbi:MAG: putative transporter [Culturomica sp.]|jgi:putative transport protein|nr:putative transporter [Culturomica sp.]